MVGTNLNIPLAAVALQSSSIEALADGPTPQQSSSVDKRAE